MSSRPPDDEPRHGPKGPGGAGVRPGLTRVFLWLLLLMIVAPVIVRWLGGGRGEQIPYTEFRELVRTGEVAEVTVRDEAIFGRLTREVADGKDADADAERDFVTYLPTFGDDELMAMLEESGVEVTTEPSSDGSFSLLLFSLLPVLLLVGLGWMLFRRMGQQGQQMFQVGRSSAKLYDRSKEDTTFDDVAGAEGAKAELREIIDYLKEPGRSRRLGGKPPRGVLLVGPPGTGKTLLARATAGEADVPFFIITGSDFMEMFVGVGASRVRNLFKEARRASPAIVFIDELDSIGRTRGAGLGGGHDEREQTLNQLLSEMDGFEAHEDVIVMAATNRPDILDPALLRPGRFDRRIVVEAPGKGARIEILKVHAREKPLAADVNLEEVARGTPGFSGADLENLLNEAALLAARKNKQKIDRASINEARDKIMLGLEREGLALTDDDCRLLAFHEAGHAVVAAVLPHADPVHKVSIVPRGQAMGVTQQLPEKDPYILAREVLLDRMAVLLGGRAAEKMVLDTATSGAENDLKEAVRLARTMVLDWGMSDSLPNLALGGRREHVFLGEQIAQQRDYSEKTGDLVDEEIRRMVDEAFGRTTGILEEHREGLDRLAEALLEREELEGDEVLELVGLKREEGVEASA